jgi:hypothetical protein
MVWLEMLYSGAISLGGWLCLMEIRDGLGAARRVEQLTAQKGEG